MCERVCARARARARVCVRACVCVCVILLIFEKCFERHTIGLQSHTILSILCCEIQPLVTCEELCTGTSSFMP